MSSDTAFATAAVGGRQSIPLGWRIWQIVAMLHGAMLIGLFYLMWFSARFMLGRWPHWGGADDPKGIPVTSSIHAAISFWLLLVPVVIVYALVGVKAFELRDPTARWKRRIAGAGLFGAGIFLAANPHHLVTWFLD